jgi:hypothetical protein
MGYEFMDVYNGYVREENILINSTTGQLFTALLLKLKNIIVLFKP